MKILLVRHAIAVDRETAGTTDELRPLTEEGIARFRKTARALNELVTPDLLLSSPLLRARQTAQILVPHWPAAPLQDSAALGTGSRSDFEAQLRALSGVNVVAAVGHEPWLSEWTAEWLGSRRAEAFAFKKGGAALIDFDGVPGEAAGRLSFFLAPKAMKKIG